MLSFRQRRFALVASLLFLLGTTAAPALHLAFHTLPHEHEHGGGPNHHDHGEGSAAHFSAALGDAPAAAIVLVLLWTIATAPLAARTERAATTIHRSVRRFRGPPACGMS